MHQVYHYDMELRRWCVAALKREHANGSADLIVYREAGTAGVHLEKVPSFNAEDGGWTPAQPGDPRVGAVLTEMAARDAAAAEAQTEAAPTPTPAPSSPVAPTLDSEPPFDPKLLSVKGLEEHLGDVNSLEALAALRVAELEGKNRKTALEAIDARATALDEE